MLQQTQVATVIPYFERFLSSFPDVATLAATDEQNLMSHWEGLGYYRRARSLHAAAKRIVQEHGGEFPMQLDDVLALPGVGRYTAGAILSISCDQRLPILEGNTKRVFSRWVALRSPPAEKQADRLLWEIAEAMLPARSGSAQFNQAAMELGALICTPKKPKCDQCPVKAYCKANSQGLQEVIPGKVTKTVYEDRTEYALVIRSGDSKSADPTNSADPTKSADPNRNRVLIRKLPTGARWAGLWDFPRTTEAFADRDTAIAALEQNLGSKIQLGEKLIQIRHAVTKYRIELHVHEATIDETSVKTEAAEYQIVDESNENHSPEGGWQWIEVARLGEYPLSVTGRKIGELISKPAHPRLF